MTHPTIRQSLKIMIEADIDEILDKLDITSIKMGGDSTVIELGMGSGLWTAGRTTLEAVLNANEIIDRSRARAEKPQTEAPVEEDEKQ